MNNADSFKATASASSPRPSSRLTKTIESAFAVAGLTNAGRQPQSAPTSFSAAFLRLSACTCACKLPRGHAPGNGKPIGGIKVNTTSGWFAARPSGTENIYKIYAESFVGADHLQRILQKAQAIVDVAISPAPPP